MSGFTWREEFYPTRAMECSKEDAIEHSLRKWEGLTPENLEKHGLRLGNGDVYEGDNIVIGLSSSTCALCAHYYDDYEHAYSKYPEDAGYKKHTCSTCPLAIARDGVPCDKRMALEKDHPFSDGYYSNNPRPMIMWLKVARKDIA